MLQQKLFSLGGFHMKSTRFHGEICRISWWNPPDFMKSAGFHLKSTQNLINSDVSAKTLQFGWISCGFHVKSGEFHVKSKDLLQGIVTLCLFVCFSCSAFEDWIQWDEYDGSSFHKSLSLAAVSHVIFLELWQPTPFKTSACIILFKIRRSHDA